MSATLPTWREITAQAHGRRLAVFEEVRRWSARSHAATRSPMSTRTRATLDALARPTRTRLVDLDQTASDRDRADAAAGDLWDAVAQAWVLVRQFDRSGGPALEHVVAELVESGRWLAGFPVLIERHDRAIDRLFDAPAALVGRGVRQTETE